MSIILANNAKSTLAAAIGALDTTLTVTSGTETLFPSPTGGDYFYVTLEDSTKTVREIVKCTARSTTTLTIVRAQDGTTANIFAIGSTVEMRVNKAALTDTISAATTAASAAATSASAAATSASAASTSASSASTSASTATTQAGIATTQATNASNSATSAASSASAAAASAASGMYSAVQDKSANYTVVAGDAGDLIRVTTTSGAVTITLPLISGTGIGDGFKIAVVKWTSDANAVNIARSGSDTINGATSAQIGSQYSQIVFVADLETSQWFASQSGLGATNVNVDTFSGNGSTTAFTLTSDPSTKNNTAVYVTGVYQQKSTYSVSGTTLTFTTAPPTGTNNIEVAYSTPLAIGTPSDGTVTTAKLASSTGSGAVVLATSPTIASPIITGSVPQITVYTSGSGTYTTPTNCRYLWVRCVGGGGGGGGSGNNSSATNGTGGGTTTFGSLSATGGAGGPNSFNGGFGGGGGGTGSGGDINIVGGAPSAVPGNTSPYAVYQNFGGAGGNSVLGGGGAPGSNGAGTTGNAGGSYGGGGSGAGTGSSASASLGGGGGGYTEKLITSPSATYSYSVGTGGTGGAAGGNGGTGGAGAAGVIIVTAYF